MLGSLILYPKGMRIMMFQLSGFYCKGCRSEFQAQGLGQGLPFGQRGFRLQDSRASVPGFEMRILLGLSLVILGL